MYCIYVKHNVKKHNKYLCWLSPSPPATKQFVSRIINHPKKGETEKGLSSSYMPFRRHFYPKQHFCMGGHNWNPDIASAMI